MRAHRAGQRASGGLRRGRRRTSPLALLAPTSALLGLASLLLEARIGREGVPSGPGIGARPAAAATLRDSAAAMSVPEAAQMAVDLFRSRRAYASLPFYRRVAPEMPGLTWDFHMEFATALQNASLETRVEGSRTSAMTRASDERVGLMLEAIRELDLAQRAAPRPRDRARVMVRRAFFLQVWGFPLDAVVELHRAMAIDPSYPDLGSIADLQIRWLQDPTISLEKMESAERRARGGRPPAQGRRP